MSGALFLLGTHQPGWLGKAEIRAGRVPLFVSDRRLRVYKTLPRAAAPWALDSGGFTELQKYGRWTVTPGEYVARVRRYRDETGRLAWAAYAGTDSIHSRLITYGDRKVAGHVH